MPSTSWGTPLKINEYIEVGSTEEIPKGQKAYVFAFQQGTQPVDEMPWGRLVNGNMKDIKDEIEKKIPGSKVLYVGASWDTATRQRIGSPSQGTDRYIYNVSGFKIEAIVENVNAGLTGLEIAGLITLIAFVAVVLGYFALSAWTTWRVVTAAEMLGPAVTIGVGIFLVVLFLIFIFLMFGGKAKLRDKKRRFEIGR